MAESPDKAAPGAPETATSPAEAPSPRAESAPVKEARASAAEPVALVTGEDKRPAPRRRPTAAAKRSKKQAAKAKPANRHSAAAASAAGDQTNPTITELKEKIMANAKNRDFTPPFADAFGEFQANAKAAYEKSTALAGEMTEFAKGNVEAVVESGKVLTAGAQDMGKTYAEDAKAAYETLTADLKELASVKSPTELFQLQGKIARRNFDTMVAFSTKTGDAMLKLYGDAFAPISGRVSLAAEKISKAA